MDQYLDFLRHKMICETELFLQWNLPRSRQSPVARPAVVTTALGVAASPAWRAPSPSALPARTCEGAYGVNSVDSGAFCVIPRQMGDCSAAFRPAAMVQIRSGTRADMPSG